MPHYLATRCPQCSKWVPIRQCEAEDPTFDPSIMVQIVCANCGNTFKLQTKALEVISEARLRST
jgi:DNA-directed RNA polymerase subunit RPC12/RpoP